MLIGSGFSIPEGLPGVWQINKKLSKIKENEILIHSSQRALFLNGKNDPNKWVRRDEKLFVQDFLEYYNLTLDGAEFQYETFYDYYSGYMTKNENSEDIDRFCAEFNQKYGFEDKSSYNRIRAFNDTFNQLLASLLQRAKYFEDIGFQSHPPYDAFISLIRDLVKKSDVKFHTLNHDIFFDWIARNHSDLFMHFSDGFQLEGSPFYGVVKFDFNKGSDKEVHKRYYVKLEHFVDKFNTPLCLFKLHGSVLVRTVYAKNGWSRLKDNYAIERFYIEEMDEKLGIMKKGDVLEDVSPDFLSGTTNKMRYYSGDEYYKNLFNHFKKNLNNSDFLLVVGYGFQDEGINAYLEEHFLSKGGNMLIIDPKLPKATLLDKYSSQYKHLSKGITDVEYKEYLSYIPEKLIDSN